jgi:DNA-binding PadR family transcriptional regulator
MSRLSTSDVVLGLLATRGSATYGYALQQQVAERLEFLELAESAIYKTLERLEADGCVERTDEHRTGNTIRVLYRATPHGKDRFRRWLSEPSSQPPLRSELHAKLVLADAESLPALLKSVEEQADACARKLSKLEEIPERAGGQIDRRWPARSRRLVDDYRARRLESTIDWLASVAAEIEEYLDSEAAGVEPRTAG